MFQFIHGCWVATAGKMSLESVTCKRMKTSKCLQVRGCDNSWIFHRQQFCEKQQNANAVKGNSFDLGSWFGGFLFYLDHSFSWIRSYTRTNAVWYLVVVIIVFDISVILVLLEPRMLCILVNAVWGLVWVKWAQMCKAQCLALCV